MLASMLCKMAFDPLKMEKLVAWAQRGQGTQHKVMLCAKSPLPTPLRHLSRSTTPHVTGPFPSHPTHSCSQNPQSFIRAKTSPKYGACGANAAWRATKTLPGLQQQQAANALGKNTKNWTSIEQPPAKQQFRNFSLLCPMRKYLRLKKLKVYENEVSVELLNSLHPCPLCPQYKLSC